jgi:hypothetical protein
MYLPPKLNAFIQGFFGDIAVIRKRFEKVEESLNNFASTVAAAEERERSKEQQETKIRGEIWFPETVEQQRSAQQEKQHTTQKVIATTTFLAFLAASIYAGIAACQLKEMRKATKATRDAADAAVSAAGTSRDSLQFVKDSFRISERPYVTVSSFTFDAPLEPDKEIGLSIIADNSGHTPALKVAFSGAAYIDGKMVEGKFMNLKGESVIPSQHPTKAHYTLSFSLTDLDRVAFSTAFKIDGTIRYTDIFNEWHSTTYCAVYDGKQKLFKFCPSGNDVK